ncbi:MAG: hypothetical protein HC859_12605, partial [Bacteroidia bacterium]|nr:hypothetical protein [Bacteroidia bacterium]
MKALPWKKIAIGVAAVALFVIAIFYFKGAGSAEQAPSYVNPAFGEYISSYSAGVLSARSPVRVILTKDVVDSTLIGQESSVKLFSFSPSLRGKTVWLDRRSVEFKPDEPMMAGQVYAVNFNVGRLIDVPTGFDSFEYTFQVMAQNYEVAIDNMKAYVKTDLKRQKVEGMFNTADYAENDNVEHALAASQDGNDLKVTWTHSGDGKQHAFIVEDVNRKDKASTVKVAVNGDAIGVERATEETVEVPSLGDFKLMQTKVVQNPTQYVVLQFSDPLKEKQNLTGLIRMEGAGSLSFEIHDNEIWIYPSVRQAGTKQLYIEPGVRNILDYKMETATSSEVVFEQVKPGVRFTGKGTILPSTSGMVLPFEAVSLKSVDVSITKIFENNILQFLQVNRLDGNYEMHRVGRRVLKKMLTLDNMGVTDLGKWNRFTLDLNQLIAAEPGAIYQVKLSFKRSYSVYACDGESAAPYEEEEDDEFDQYYDEGYYEEEDYYYYEDYDWNERDNPCNGSYYTRNRNVFKNILASDIGLISKRGSDGNTTVIATDLKTAQPLSGVQVALYDFQQQVLASGATGTDGKLVAKTDAPPFVVTATSGTQRGYLRLQDGEALSVAHFDVSGEAVQKGLKGFLYGERGVWRPGDSLYLTFVLEDKNKVLPPAHPVVFELQNPQGQVTSRIVRSTSENGFYNFATATSAEAPTGNWLGRVKVGGTEFSQTVKIETVKPNRLKINLDFGTERFTSPSVQGKLDVKWLHGAPARNLKAEFNVLLASVPTRFNKYDDFVFDDPARDFQSETLEVYSGYTDAEGKATVNAELTTSNAAPGFLNAVFRGKVFEESGNFSIDNFSIPYSPYASYVGLRTGKGERYSGILYLDTLQRVDVVSLDGDGKPVSRNGVQMTLYKLDRRWWWDNSYNNIANYVEGSYSNVVAKGTINTSNGKGTWTFEAKSPDWGRYFIRACDPVSGHCTGKVIYMDDKGWYSRYRGEEGQGAASMLSFSTDKQSYNIGEKVKLSIPGSAQGKALVSIENGSKVIQTYWVDTQAGENAFSFDVTTEMTPNAFVHVTLLQRHDQTTNDRPIRLYGIMPFRVEDPATHLEPVLTMPDVLEPGEEVVIKVSEKTKQKMTYTVAVVDEGLLDLTRFKTPDPWNRFYAREALGVRTWDLYDQVMGAFGARLERLLAVGGDMERRAQKVAQRHDQHREPSNQWSSGKTHEEYLATGHFNRFPLAHVCGARSAVVQNLDLWMVNDLPPGGL